VLEGEASSMRCIFDAMHLRCEASPMRCIFDAKPSNDKMGGRVLIALF